MVESNAVKLIHIRQKAQFNDTKVLHDPHLVKLEALLVKPTDGAYRWLCERTCSWRGKKSVTLIAASCRDKDGRE